MPIVLHILFFYNVIKLYIFEKYFTIIKMLINTFFKCAYCTGGMYGN